MWCFRSWESCCSRDHVIILAARHLDRLPGQADLHHAATIAGQDGRARDLVDQEAAAALGEVEGHMAQSHSGRELRYPQDAEK